MSRIARTPRRYKKLNHHRAGHSPVAGRGRKASVRPSSVLSSSYHSSLHGHPSDLKQRRNRASGGQKFILFCICLGGGAASVLQPGNLSEPCASALHRPEDLDLVASSPRSEWVTRTHPRARPHRRSPAAPAHSRTARARGAEAVFQPWSSFRAVACRAAARPLTFASTNASSITKCAGSSLLP